MTREHFLLDWFVILVMLSITIIHLIKEPYEDSEAKQIGWALDFFVSLLIVTVLFVFIY